MLKNLMRRRSWCGELEEKRRAWSTPVARTTGDLITAVIWNQDVVDNPVALRAGGIAIASQAIGDLPYASSTTQLGRIAAVAVGQVLVSAGTGTVPAWSANPQLTTVKLNSGTGITLNDNSGAMIIRNAANNARASVQALGGDFTNPVTVSYTGGTQAVFAGWDDSSGADATNNGSIRIGSATDYFGSIHFEGLTNGYFYMDHRWDSANARIYFRLRTAGIPVNGLILGPAGAVVAGTVQFAAMTAATFVAGDKYLVIDASGNIHVSALGPAS